MNCPRRVVPLLSTDVTIDAIVRRYTDKSGEYIPFIVSTPHTEENCLQTTERLWPKPAGHKVFSVSIYNVLFFMKKPGFGSMGEIIEILTFLCNKTTIQYSA